jgi:hypothetical protein
MVKPFTDDELRAMDPELAARIRATVQAAVGQVSRERLREALPVALALALCESRAHHRSVLTGRCGVVAGW